MKSLGLGEYCYGKVTVVDSSKFSSNSAAFYVKNTDEIYLSPDLQGQRTCGALCHELSSQESTRSSTRYEVQGVVPGP